MNKLVILFVIVACLSIGIDGRVYQVIDSFSQFQAALQLAPSPYGETPADYDWFSPYNTNGVNPPAVFIKNTREALGGQRDSILGFKTTSSSGITARFSLLPAAGTALVAFPIGYVGASYVQWDGNDQSAGQGPTVPFPAAILSRNPGIGSNVTSGGNADGRSYDFTFAGAAKGLTIQITSDLDVVYTLTALDTSVGINIINLPIIGAENVTRNYYIRYDDRRWTQVAFNWAQTTAFQVKVTTNGGVSGAIDTSYRLLNIYTFEIGGTVYVDCGCDGTPEGGIANLTMDLFNTTGGINVLVDNTNTNATGSYRFFNFNFPNGEIVTAQTYRICIRDTSTSLCNNQNRCTDVTLSNPIIDQLTFDYYVIPPATLAPPPDVSLECGQSTATSNTGVAQLTSCNGTTPVTTNSDSLNQQACVTTITRTFTDTGSGRTVTQRITVTDTQPPTFTVQPSSPTVSCGGTPTLAQYVQSNGGAQAIDTCNFQGITNNFTTGGVGNCGAITLQFTARDTCGLTATAIGTYTTNDVNPPTFTQQPTPLNIECDFTTTGNNPNTRISNYLANRGNLVVTDDCTSSGSITVNNDFVSTTLTPATACAYSQTVTFTARDQCNNAATATSLITVSDTIGPQITRQASDVQGQCGSGSSGNDFQSFLTNRGGATASDICSTGASDLVWTNDASGSNPGATCGDSTTVTFTVRDQCGRTNSTSARYVIVDNTPPTITTQASNASPQCDGQGNVADYSNFLANRGGFVASDNCGPVTYSNNAPPTGPTGCGQSVTVTFTATQQCTPVLSVSSVATYSIRDSTPPTFSTVPQSQTVECSASAPDQFQAFLSNNAGAVASDACSNQGLTIQNNNNGATINNGCANTVTVTFTARDGCGNVSPGAFASFTIRDTTAPVLTTPASDLTLTCGPTNNQDFINWRNTQGGAVATDSCTQVTWTSNDTSVISSGCNSARVVTFTASDACNNLVRTTATFRVTDNEAPTIVTPAQNAQFECNGSGNLADIQGFLNTRAGATATDNCGAVTWSNNFSALTGTCTRAATVTFVATDPCGLTSATTATISVVDNNAPTISPGASDFALECNQGTNNQAFQNYINTRGGANAFDLCQQNGTLVWTNNAVASPDGCTSAQITFTVTDPCGRSASTTGTFTIRDRTAPVITTPPRSVAVECDGNGNVNDYNSFVATNGGLVAEDNCAVRLTVTNNAPTTGPVGCGSRQVTFNVADLCGNSVSTQAIFTVYDSQAPVFTVLPANVTQECARRNDTSPFQEWLRTRGGAQAVDVCSGGNITLSAELDELSSASKCNQYADIEFKARDACGQASSVVGRYTVVDTTAPVLLQPAVNQFLECSEVTNVDDINFWILGNGFASATDACTSVEWSNNFNDVYPEECQGPIAVTFTATDVCGLSVSTTATAQIDDNIAPIFLNFPRNVVITCRNATDPSVTGTPDAFDSYCDNEIVPTYTDVVRQNPNVNFCPGDTIIERTWTISDDCGNFNTRTQIITQTVPEGPCSFTPCPPCGTTNVCCDSTREAVPCNPVPCNSVPCRPVQCSSVPCTPRSCGNGTPLYDDDDIIDPTPLPTRAPGQNCEPVYVYVYDDDDAVNPPQTNNQSAQSASSLLTVTFTVLLAAIFLLV